MARFVGGFLVGVGVIFLLAFPILEILGVWTNGNIVHRYVGSGFLCLLFGLIFAGVGALLMEE